MAGQLQVITGIATTLIALIAGLTLNLERMGRRLTAIVRMTGVMLGLTTIGLAVMLWVAWPWLPIAPSATGGVKLANALAFRRDRRQLLADDDRGGNYRHRSARPPERDTCCDGRAGRSGGARLVLISDADRAPGVQGRGRREHGYPRSIRVANRGRRRIRRLGRRVVALYMRYTRSRSHAGAARFSALC